MTDYDAVVVGAGCGGMTAAVTLAQSGLSVLMLEKHNIPGGCATSFCRGRFEFEVSLHQLSGIGTEDKPGLVRLLLQQMGALDRLELVQEDTLYGVKIAGQLDTELPANRAELVSVLKQIFPDNGQHIETFIEFLYDFMNEYFACVMALDPEANPQKYPIFFKYALTDTQSIFDKFLPNPQLQICLGSFIGYMGLPTHTLPFQQLAICLWSYLEFLPSHFVGGSQALSNALVDCFTQAGGQVKFNTAVDEIIVENGQVKGVITEHGQRISTRCVVSNASSIDTYLKIIKPDHVPQSLVEDLNSKELAVSAFSVYLGLDCTPGELGITTPSTFLYDETADLRDVYGNPNEPPKGCGLTCYDNISSRFSPQGACQLVLIVPQYSEPWHSIPTNEYTDVKYRYANDLIVLVEKFFPGIRERIEEMEISTPITHMRYLSTPGGSIYGFSPYNKESRIFSDSDSPIKGLYLAGAWAGGGGYQPTLMSGVSAGQAAITQFAAQQVAV
jgi:phytoene dehydrogenase-like protein